MRKWRSFHMLYRALDRGRQGVGCPRTWHASCLMSANMQQMLFPSAPFSAWVKRNSAVILIVWAVLGMFCLLIWCAGL